MTAPLRGLRVLDLSTYVAGPSATMTLAQLGAEVVRVDPIGGASDVRRLPVDGNGTSLYWAGLNKSKRSIAVDLRSEDGRALVRELVARAGIVVTNVVGQAWLHYDALRAVRPDLIMVRILGHADGRPAVDYTVNAEVGLPWLTGPADLGRPVNHVLPAWDLIAGLHAALAVLTAERVRREDGVGQLVELALSDVAVSAMAHLGFVADVVVNGNRRRRDGNYLYGAYGCDFATRDGRRVMVVALTGRHWRSLVDIAGIGDAIAALERILDVDFAEERVRYQHRAAVSALLSPWFESHTHAAVTAALAESQMLWSDYHTVEEMVTAADGLLATSGLFHDVHQPGVGTFPVPGPVLRMSEWRQPPVAPAPRMGEDTAPVLRDWLGYDDAALADLRDRKLIEGI